MVFLAVQKLFSFMSLHFIFAFAAFAFGVKSKNFLPRPISNPHIFSQTFSGFRSYIQA